jgi:hypothetical protein
MPKSSRELLRDYIREQSFSNPDSILNIMKEMSKNVFQEVLESENDIEHKLK